MKTIPSEQVAEFAQTFRPGTSVFGWKTAIDVVGEKFARREDEGDVAEDFSDSISELSLCVSELQR